MREIICVAGLAAAAAFGLTACGTSTPASSISQSGTYLAGEDIMPGTWKISRGIGTVDKPCEWHVWHGDNLVLGSETTAAGKGIEVPEGYELITNHCGEWSHTTPEQEAERAEILKSLGVDS